MGLIGGICPKQSLTPGKKHLVDYCINKCPESCYPPHLLEEIFSYKSDKDDYTFSVTELGNPPQLVYLQRKQNYYMPYWKLWGRDYGRGMHRGLQTGSEFEEGETILKVNDFKIRGRLDFKYLQKLWILDFKTLGVYSVDLIFQNGIMSEKPEIVYQLNIYNISEHKINNITAKRLRLWYIVRDWKPKDMNYTGFKKNIKREKPFPPCGWIEIPVLPEEEVIKWIKERCMLLHDCLITGTYPPCSKKDLWDRTDNMRCKFYCDVSDICSQYKGEK